MSIQSRIKDAETFWQEARKEEALLAVLTAANEIARRRYPQAKSPKESMTYFVMDAVGQISRGAVDPFDWTFRGGVSLGEVLYDAYRTLLETKKLPSDLELVPGEEFQVQILPGNRRAYTDCLIPRLLEVVKQTPESRR